MSNQSETALAVNNTGFNALANVNLSNLIADELSGLDISFEQIKIPAGGVTMYEMPGEDGDTESVKEFSGVILYHHPLNVYYKTKYTGGNNPPDCSSLDGAEGTGVPGGSCRSCPLNQFGSKDTGGKACQNRRRIFILREGEIFPLLLSLPVGSIKVFTTYIKRLLASGRKSNSVVTRFTLQKATNAGGVVYSQAHFAVDRTLDPSEVALIERMSDEVRAFSQQIAVVDEDNEPGLIVDPETGEIIEPLNGGNSQ
jgi:hypothetical protein